MAEPLDTFRLIVKDYKQSLPHIERSSEADTRANVIDRLIHSVLEWPHDEKVVKREPYTAAGYIDYRLNINDPIIVLEAKADGETFQLPYRKIARRRLKLSGSLCSDTKVKDTVDQAHAYCIESGAPFAVATNGSAFIIFRAMIEKSSWRDENAIVFRDLEDIEKHFTDFWNLLSYEAVASGSLGRAFSRTQDRAREYYRPIDELVDADATYGRNPLNTVLRPYVRRFFGDIGNHEDTEILKNCYVKSTPVQRIDEGLQWTIVDRRPTFANDAVELQDNAPSRPSPLLNQIDKAVLQESPTDGMLVLMGGIGSGKSTYCQRFFRIISPKLFDEDGPAHLIYMNLYSAPNYPEQLRIFFWNELASQLRQAGEHVIPPEAYREMFASELSMVRNIYADTSQNIDQIVADRLYDLTQDDEKFALNALKYVASHSKRPLLTFDNVDQLDLEVQRHIVTMSQQVISKTQSLCLLVLREESYSAGMMKRHFTAGHFYPFHLASPRFRDLIQARIKYAIEDAKQRAKNSEATDDQKHYAAVAQLFGLLQKSVLGVNKNIIRLVESVAYGNMRMALDLFNKFITSGATDIPKIINAYKTRGGYTVPFHEFTKSITLGDYRYYKESRSSILNLFNVTKGANASHFTSLRILKHLAIQAGTSGLGRSGDTFVALSTLIDDVATPFDNEDDCKETLLRLAAVDRQLVEFDTHRPDTLAGAGEVKITTCGRYYLDYLVNSFSYLDLVWNDTPFATRGEADSLRRRIQDTHLNKRFTRVERFLSYLEKEETEELASKSLDIKSAAWFGPFMPRIRKHYTNEREVIKSKVTASKRRSSRRVSPTK